jgi:hypothetical protein
MLDAVSISLLCEYPMHPHPESFCQNWERDFNPFSLPFSQVWEKGLGDEGWVNLPRKVS